MKKTLNILVLTAMLVVTTIGNMQLWKCLTNGDILWDNGCAIELLYNTCCKSAEKSDEVTIDSKCCEIIDITTDLTMDRFQPSLAGKDRKTVDFSVFLASENEVFTHLKNKVHFFNNLPPPEEPLLTKLPLHLTHCSFLC